MNQALRIKRHPATFWVLASIAVLSLMFSISSYISSLPKREIVFRLDRIGSIDLGPHPLGVLTSSQSSGDTFRSLLKTKYSRYQLKLWNNGTEEITNDHIFDGITLQLNKGTVSIIVELKNVKKNMITHLIENNTVELNSLNLFPNTGVLIDIVSLEDIDNIDVLGSYIDVNGKRIGVRNIKVISITGDKAFDLVIIVTIILFMVLMYVIRQTKINANRKDIFGNAFFLMFMMGSAVFTLYLIIVVVVTKAPF